MHPAHDEALRFLETQGFPCAFTQTREGWVGTVAGRNTPARNNFDEAAAFVAAWVELYRKEVPCPDVGEALKWLLDHEGKVEGHSDGRVTVRADKLQIAHTVKDGSPANVARGLGVARWLDLLPRKPKARMGP